MTNIGQGNYHREEMARKILINASEPEEVRVAVVKEGVLVDFFVELPSHRSILGNIYKGRVTHVEGGLQAAFVDFGEKREGFLPFREIHFLSKDGTSSSSLSRHQEVIVQVTREEMGKKGAALTTYLSLPGRYLVLLPFKEIKGVSTKIEEAKRRKRLKEMVSQFPIPEGMGFIVRTAAANRTKRELLRDFHYLLRLWRAIRKRAEELQAPSLLYQESDVVVKSLRDYFSADVREVIVDEEGTYRRVMNFFNEVMPNYRRRVKLYQDPLPLFSRYQVEDQIDRLFLREVPLPSGGKICIDVTEALVAIDVNSGKVQQARDIEETALITNLEAAEEIARQVRLRDLGGLIVIDFIDMRSPENRREVERRLRQAFKEDRAKVDFSRISRFGLLELSRQRLRSPLAEGIYVPCQRCRGLGRIKSPVSTALSVLRKVKERLATDGELSEVKVFAPPDVAQYLREERREELRGMEKGRRLKVLIEEDPGLGADEFRVECRKKETALPWYKRIFG